MSRSVRSSPRSSSVAEPVEQRARRLRVRRGRDVVRHRRPDRRRREARRAGPCRAARRRCRSGLRSATAACRAAPRAPRRWRSRCTGSGACAACRRAARRASRSSRSPSCARPRSRRRRTSATAGSARRRAAARGRGRRPGVEPAENASAGQWIVRMTPSTSSTVGRAAWKSRYSSMSSVANTRALDAARQPAHRVARGVGRVVPARERGDERGAPQRRFRVPADGHPFTLHAPCRTGTGVLRPSPISSLVVSRRDDFRSLVTRSREVVLAAAIVGALTGVAVAGFDRADRRRLRSRRRAPAAVADGVRAGRRARDRRTVACGIPGVGSRGTRLTSTSVRSTAGEGLGVRDMLHRMVAAVATLGSGCAMGLEGPSIYMGATIGSALQRRWRSVSGRRRSRTCCSSRARPRASPRSSRRPRPARSSRSRCRSRKIWRVACCSPR